MKHKTYHYQHKKKPNMMKNNTNFKKEATVYIRIHISNDSSETIAFTFARINLEIIP